MEGTIGAERKITKVVVYRDGLMIALLAQRPLCLRTFSLIRVGTHLRKVGEEWRLVFEGPETKSGRPFEITVPEKLVPSLAANPASGRNSQLARLRFRAGRSFGKAQIWRGV